MKNGRAGWMLILAIALVLSAGCADNSVTGLSLSGSWSGTAGGQGLFFDVDGDAIKALDVYVPITSGNCGVAGIRRTYQPSFSVGTVSGNAFSVDESGLTMTGVFSSSTAASGTVSMTLTTSGTGSPCNGSGSTSWSATR